MQKKAKEYVKKCDQCQRFAPNIHQPGGVLNPLSSLWSFAQWDLDIVGPFLKPQGIKGTCWSAQITSPSGLKLKPLALGDLVLRKVLGTAKNLAWGKWGPN